MQANIQFKILTIVTFGVALPSCGSSTTTITALHIVNMLGQKVLSMTPNSKEFTLDVSGLSSGAYFINAITNGVTTTKKLIRK